MWLFGGNSYILKNVTIGDNTTIGRNVYIDKAVKIGNNFKIQNNVSIFHGVEIGNNVFIGPHVCFTNDKYPKAVDQDWNCLNTKIGEINQ